MTDKVVFCCSACDNWSCGKKASYSTMRRLEKEGKVPVFEFMHKDCKRYIKTWATTEIEEETKC